MLRKSNSISILQFDEHIISLLRVQRGKAIAVQEFAVEYGPWSATDGSLASALRTFRGKHALDGDTVCTVMPRHDMTARILELPSHDETEIEGMVRLGAEEYVPYPVEDLVIDQCVLRKLPDGQATVLAAFVHKDAVEHHVGVLRDAGIQPDEIYMSTACLAAACMHAKAGEERYMLVNIASSGLEVLGMHGGRLEYGRGVAVAQGWEADGEPNTGAVAELSTEVRASLSAYRRDSEDGEGAQRIYLCSEWAELGPACEVLFQETGQECEPAGFAKSLIAQGAEKVHDALPLSSLGAALAALGQTEVQISLVPRSVVAERERSGRQRSLLLGGGLAAAIALVCTGIYGQAVYQRTRYMNDLQSRIAALRPVAEEVERKQARLARLHEHVNSEGSAVELLARLCEIMPPAGINLSRFVFSHGEGIVVEGHAETVAGVFRLLDDLRAAGEEDVPQFAHAQRESFETEALHGTEIQRYTIRIPFGQEEQERDSGGGGAQ